MSLMTTFFRAKHNKWMLINLKRPKWRYSQPWELRAHAHHFLFPPHKYMQPGVPVRWRIWSCVLLRNHKKTSTTIHGLAVVRCRPVWVIPTRRNPTVRLPQKVNKELIGYTVRPRSICRPSFRLFTVSLCESEAGSRRSVVLRFPILVTLPLASWISPYAAVRNHIAKLNWVTHHVRSKVLILSQHAEPNACPLFSRTPEFWS